MDETAVEAEQQALSDLFAGAIGVTRILRATDTCQLDLRNAEMIMLASHLLRIVDFLSSQPEKVFLRIRHAGNSLEFSHELSSDRLDLRLSGLNSRLICVCMKSEIALI